MCFMVRHKSYRMKLVIAFHTLEKYRNNVKCIHINIIRTLYYISFTKQYFSLRILGKTPLSNFKENEIGHLLVYQGIITNIILEILFLEVLSFIHHL